MLKRVALVFGLVLAGTANAQSVDFNLSDDSAEGKFTGPLKMGTFGRGFFDVGFIYKDNVSDDNYLAGFGLGVAGDAGTDAPGLQFGVEVNAFWGEAQRVDMGAISLGGLVRYAPPPMSRFYGLYRINLAPQITTFKDGKDFFYHEARLGYEILPEADIYVGYRKAEIGLSRGGDATIDDGGFVGVKIMF